jgi:hypothetical protein
MTLILGLGFAGLFVGLMGVKLYVNKDNARLIDEYKNEVEAAEKAKRNKETKEPDIVFDIETIVAVAAEKAALAVAKSSKLGVVTVEPDEDLSDAIENLATEDQERAEPLTKSIEKDG